MDLNLTEKLTPEEIVELRKRVFSFSEQMYMQGISVGRSLNRADFEYDTETFVKDKISAMSSYVVRDDVWKSMPPHGYNPDPKVDIPEPSAMKISEMERSINAATKGVENVINSASDLEERNNDVEKPEWADKVKPFN